MAGMRYRNAATLLPPELLAAIQQHINGCYLWIPSTSKNTTDDRNAQIVAQYKAGVPVKRIAHWANLSTNTVYKIVGEHKLAQRYAQE